jgi:hypothetical protein
VVKQAAATWSAATSTSTKHMQHIKPVAPFWERDASTTTNTDWIAGQRDTNNRRHPILHHNDEESLATTKTINKTSIQQVQRTMLNLDI